MNCKPGSAWHEWQTAGAEWKKENPLASPEERESAADRFAHEFPIGNPDAAYGARKRAFIEGTAQ